MDNFKLCYVDRNFAYFTTQALDKQWGDDWDDKLYDCNAGTPYGYADWNKERGDAPWEIAMVAYDGPLYTPADSFHGNANYSVKEINAGAIAWLVGEGDDLVVIPVGTTLPGFLLKVKQAGGEVYMTEALWRRLEGER